MRQYNDELPGVKKSSVDAYRSIRAPESLRERVLASAAELDVDGIIGAPVMPSSRTRTRMRAHIAARALASAAAIALVMTGVFALYRHEPRLSLAYEGEEVADAKVEIQQPAVAAIMFDLRSTPMGVPFTLKAEGKSTISVTGGSVEICTADGEEVAYAGDGEDAVLDSGGAEVEYMLYWSGTDETSTLTVSVGNVVSEYVMTSSDGTVTVEKSEKK